MPRETSPSVRVAWSELATCAYAPTWDWRLKEVEKASDRGPRQDFWAASEPPSPQRTWSPGRSYASKRSAPRASSCFWARFAGEPVTEAVLSPWHRPSRVEQTRHLPYDLDRGLTIRTRAATTA